MFGLRAIGKGSQSGKTLFAMLDLPSPPVRFERYNPLLVRSLNKVATESMLQATDEAVSHNVDDNGSESRDISVGLDGTWQRRGYSSLNGVVPVSSFDTRKILDAEVLTKYCHTYSMQKVTLSPIFVIKISKGLVGPWK